MIDLVFKSLFSHFVLTVMMSFISSGFIYMILSFPYAHYNFADNLPVEFVSLDQFAWKICVEAVHRPGGFFNLNKETRLRSINLEDLRGWSLWIYDVWMDVRWTVDWMDVLDETWGDMRRRSHVSTQNILVYFSQCRAGQKNVLIYGIRLGISTIWKYTPPCFIL